MKSLNIQKADKKTIFEYVQTSLSGDTIIINNKTSFTKVGTQWYNNSADTFISYDDIKFLIECNI